MSVVNIAGEINKYCFGSFVTIAVLSVEQREGSFRSY